MMIKLDSSDKCWILTALERCQDAPEATLERAAAVLGKDAPWAPFRTLTDWQDARLDG
jgi:hypothetical protein